jgi:hypothetical protein
MESGVRLVRDAVNVFGGCHAPAARRVCRREGGVDALNREISAELFPGPRRVFEGFRVVR